MTEESKQTTTKNEKSESSAKIIVRLKHGSYVGLGCMNHDKRLREDDVGFGFTHDHPARVQTKDVVWKDDNGYEHTRHDYVSGEMVQLFPIPDHEKASADEIKAKDKRFTFSLKEAQKRAKQMLASGQAELVTGSLSD